MVPSTHLLSVIGIIIYIFHFLLFLRLAKIHVSVIHWTPSKIPAQRSSLIRKHFPRTFNKYSSVYHTEDQAKPKDVQTFPFRA